MEAYKNFYELNLGDNIYLIVEPYPLKIVPLKIINIEEYPKDAPSKDRFLELEVESKYKKFTLKIPIRDARRYYFFYDNYGTKFEKSYYSDLNWLIQYKKNVLENDIKKSSNKINSLKKQIKKEEEKIKKYLVEKNNINKSIIYEEET